MNTVRYRQGRVDRQRLVAKDIRLMMDRADVPGWIERFLKATASAPVSRVHFSVGMTMLVDFGAPKRLGRKGQPDTGLSIFLGYEWFMRSPDTSELTSSRSLTREFVEASIQNSILNHVAYDGVGDLELGFDCGVVFRTGPLSTSETEAYEPDWNLRNEDDCSNETFLDPESAA